MFYSLPLSAHKDFMTNLHSGIEAFLSHGPALVICLRPVWWCLTGSFDHLAGWSVKGGRWGRGPSKLSSLPWLWLPMFDTSGPGEHSQRPTTTPPPPPSQHLALKPAVSKSTWCSAAAADWCHRADPGPAGCRAFPLGLSEQLVLNSSTFSFVVVFD